MRNHPQSLEYDLPPAVDQNEAAHIARKFQERAAGEGPAEWPLTRLRPLRRDTVVTYHREGVVTLTGVLRPELIHIELDSGGLGLAAVQDIADDPAVLANLADILGGVHHTAVSARILSAGDDATAALTQAHDHGVDVCVPLHTSTLRVLRGSHRWGPLGDREALQGIDRSALTTIDLHLGDVAVLHPALAREFAEGAHAVLLVRYVPGPIPTASAPTQRPELGGGAAPLLLQGERTAFIEKRHLIIGRVMRERAALEGTSFIDVGTDYHYPFYFGYYPTRLGMAELASSPELLLHYPSSFGLVELRHEVSRFMRGFFDVDADEMKQVMINTGASQAFDALSRGLAGTWVLLPDLSLPTVASIASGNGAELMRVPLDRDTGMMDLAILDRILGNITARGESVRFLYLNSPCNPTGAVGSTEYLTELVAVARRHHTLIVHDMDSWYTRHSGDQVPNILQIPGAMDCAVTVLSISKEFGLAGARVGFLVGNSEVIDTVRTHNSLFCVMIPEVCQRVAYAALASFDADLQKPAISADITALLDRCLDGWRSLGWPEQALIRPQAGFKFLLAVPPGIAATGEFCAAELFDFFVTSRAYVKLSTSLSFNPNNTNYLRMVIMQNMQTLDELFDRLHRCGVSWDMTLDPSIAAEFKAVVAENVLGDF